MATYPKDRFDQVPDDLLRVGAHRAPGKRGRGWVAFAWAALATGVLVVGGLYGLNVITGKVGLNNPFVAASNTPDATVSTTPSPTPSATLNAALPITILNGTATTGLANLVGDDLVKQGWAGAATGIGFRGNASSKDIKTTTVYYGDAANEGAARGLLLALKVGTISLSSAFPDSPVTIVVGADYKAPAG